MFCYSMHLGQKGPPRAVVVSQNYSFVNKSAIKVICKDDLFSNTFFATLYYFLEVRASLQVPSVAMGNHWGPRGHSKTIQRINWEGEGVERSLFTFTYQTYQGHIGHNTSNSGVNTFILLQSSNPGDCNNKFSIIAIDSNLEIAINKTSGNCFQ